jgi:hypothetical protein
VLVDAVVLAAAEAIGIPPLTFANARAAVYAAFCHARDLRLDPADVAAALEASVNPPVNPRANAAVNASGATSVPDAAPRPVLIPDSPALDSRQPRGKHTRR